jgi:hypothetical protein
MEPLPTLSMAEKTIPYFPGWSEPEPETSYIWFDIPLEIGGIVEPGVLLHGGCYSNRPDCHVTFELRVAKRPGRHRVPLMRVEWRSLTGGHIYPRRRGSELSGLRVPPTHFHPFEPNYHEGYGRMYGGNLRMAMRIDEELQTFEEARRFAGNLFRISNIEIVAPPGWEYSLGLERP